MAICWCVVKVMNVSIWTHRRYGVSGYPTLKFFPKGNKAGEDYDGGRDLDDFVAFINERAGTSRDSKGLLTAEVNIDFVSRWSSMLTTYPCQISGHGGDMFEHGVYM